jgi:hypothetical protein
MSTAFRIRRIPVDGLLAALLHLGQMGGMPGGSLIAEICPRRSAESKA